MVCCTISNDSAQVKIDFIQLFYNITLLLVEAILSLIPSDLKNHRITIFLRFVTD